MNLPISTEVTLLLAENKRLLEENKAISRKILKYEEKIKILNEVNNRVYEEINKTLQKQGRVNTKTGK